MARVSGLVCMRGAGAPLPQFRGKVNRLQCDLTIRPATSQVGFRMFILRLRLTSAEELRELNSELRAVLLALKFSVFCIEVGALYGLAPSVWLNECVYGTIRSHGYLLDMITGLLLLYCRDICVDFQHP